MAERRGERGAAGPVRPSALLVVRERSLAGDLARVLGDCGLAVRTVSHPWEAVGELRRARPALVVQELDFGSRDRSGREGLALLRRLRDIEPGLPVLVVSASAALDEVTRRVEQPVAALRRPCSHAALTSAIGRLVGSAPPAPAPDAPAPVAEPLGEARRQLAERHDLRGAIYASRAMHGVLAQAVRVAASDLPVLVTGPTGAGKELVAEVVHLNSGRAGSPLVRLNIGAIPEPRLDEELFGLAGEEGQPAHDGHFQLADGGTLLLDEIANLSPTGQIKLLRVLESGEVVRCGGVQAEAVDVRVVATSNRDLRRAAALGHFRSDLLFRVDVVELHVPPLADRPEDILPIAEQFLASAAAERGERPLELSRASRSALLEHDWPGNVRELRNRVQRAALLARGEHVDPADLGLPARTGFPEDRLLPPEDRERDRLMAVLERHGGVVAEAAEELGISRQGLYGRMRRLGVRVERRVRQRAPYEIWG